MNLLSECCGHQGFGRLHAAAHGTQEPQGLVESKRLMASRALASFRGFERPHSSSQAGQKTITCKGIVSKTDFRHQEDHGSISSCYWSS